MADNQISPEQGKEKKKEKGTLESVIDELWSFGKKAIAIGTIAAMPYVFAPFAPAHIPRAQVTAYTMAAGRATSNLIQKKPALENSVKDAMIGNILSYPTAKVFEGLNNLEGRIAPTYGTAAAKAAKMGSWAFAVQPGLSASYTAFHYGLGKQFREHAWPRIKTTFKYLALPGALNAAFVSYFGIFAQMAVSAGLWYSFALIQALKGGEGSLKNLFKTLNPFSYLKASANVSYKLVRNTTKGLFDAVYAIGSSVRDLYKASPKAEAPKPAAKSPESAKGT